MQPVCCIDNGLLEQQALQSADAFTKEQLMKMEDVLEEDNCDDVIEAPKCHRFFFCAWNDAGIRQGIDYVRGGRIYKYRVGDHVRVRYREQEGTVVDINGDLYMVFLNDGGYVDSYYEDQLEQA